jgi:hypothetical protein
LVAVWQSLTVMRLQLSIGPNSLRLALASPHPTLIGIVQEMILLIARKDVTLVKYSRAKEILRNGAAL